MSKVVRFTLRLPDDLHRRLVKLANQEKRSLNNLIIVLLEKGLKELEVNNG